MDLLTVVDDLTPGVSLPAGSRPCHLSQSCKTEILFGRGNDPLVKKDNLNWNANVTWDRRNWQEIALARLGMVQGIHTDNYI